MNILYRDDHITVVDKPSGLLVHRSALSSDEDSLVDRLREHFAALGEDAPSPVHRLDRPASGIVLCANDSETARLLCDSFIKGEVHKYYHAIVRGWVIEAGEIDIPLQKYKQGKVVKENKEEQEAFTRYTPLLTGEIPVGNNRFPTSRYSLIQAEPVTGRYHQLRRHLARIGHPIVGDTAHGDLRHNKILRDYCGNERLLLHARQIRFPHPVEDKIIEIEAPYPPEFDKILHSVFGLVQ
ncbi:MAG: pseudouridine synthase [Spirochaetales bacterium]|nr:pseudouridine synthase [Spirochaetales bacterium]